MEREYRDLVGKKAALKQKYERMHQTLLQHQGTRQHQGQQQQQSKALQGQQPGSEEEDSDEASD